MHHSLWSSQQSYKVKIAIIPTFQISQQSMSISTDSLTSILCSRTDVFSYESHAWFFTSNIEKCLLHPQMQPWSSWPAENSLTFPYSVKPVFLKTPTLFLPQDLCTCYSSFMELCSPDLHEHSSFIAFRLFWYHYSKFQYHYFPLWVSVHNHSTSPEQDYFIYYFLFLPLEYDPIKGKNWFILVFLPPRERHLITII